MRAAPDPTHHRSHVVGYGVRVGLDGTVRRRYRCTPLVGDPHVFHLVDAAGEATRPDKSSPPACALHPDSRVVRDGTYGKRTEWQDQVRECVKLRRRHLDDRFFETTGKEAGTGAYTNWCDKGAQVIADAAIALCIDLATCRPNNNESRATPPALFAVRNCSRRRSI